jgi:hypothetical protein
MKHEIQREAANEQFEAWFHEKLMEEPDPARRLELFKQFVLCFVKDDRINSVLTHIYRLEKMCLTLDGAVQARAEFDVLKRQ